MTKMIFHKYGTTKTRVIGILLACYALSLYQMAGALDRTIPGDLEAKQVTLSGKKIKFAEVLATLSKQIGHSIVADGEPKLSETDFNIAGPAKQALDQVADSFDYLWTVGKQGAILFNKRFKNREEYPQLNLPEMRQMAMDALKILTWMDFDKDVAHQENLLTDLYQSFTPEQATRLKRGDLLRADDLSEGQRHLLQAAILNNGFSNTYYIFYSLSVEATVMPTSYLQMREWPTFYQLRRHSKPTDIPGQHKQFEFDYVGTGKDGQEYVRHLDVPLPPIP